jgi:hypothetical protein
MNRGTEHAWCASAPCRATMFLISDRCFRSASCFRSLIRCWLLHLIEQHGGKFVVAHALNFADVVANHKLRINLVDFLGDRPY